MTQVDESPFHAGERDAQRRAGVGDVSKWAGGFVRDHLPEQHRAFHTSLPFMVFAGADAEGRIWTTLVDGADGFIRSPDPKRLTLDTVVDGTDPLAALFAASGDIGALGIELATRRRNRFSGRLSTGDTGLVIDMRQTFGNCPQYIHPRGLTRVARRETPVARRSEALSEAQMARIGQADTLFIGSGHHDGSGAASNGFDASHRGGAPGFVRVEGPGRLLIPDYAGNNFFNTIGNLMSDPRVGLVFVDFETGGLLHVTGRARVDWAPGDDVDPEAWRVIEVEIEAVVERPGALSLRWTRLDGEARKLRLARRVRESDGITSFWFAPVDGRPLTEFKPGQHLPVAVQIPGQSGMTERSYSLSGMAADRTHYRLSIKREDRGLMSRFLHDHLRRGDLIEARPPGGDFGVPDGDGPVVLVSAGVGLTPMVSMLHALAGSGRRVWYVHGARNGRDHAMRAEVDGLMTRHGNLRRRVFYSRPDRTDVPGVAFDVAGRMTAEAVAALEDPAEARYLLCGPGRFLTDMQAGLEACGVPPGHILFERFGPDGKVRA